MSQQQEHGNAGSGTMEKIKYIAKKYPNGGLLSMPEDETVYRGSKPESDYLWLHQYEIDTFESIGRLPPLDSKVYIVKGEGEHGISICYTTDFGIASLCTKIGWNVREENKFLESLTKPELFERFKHQYDPSERACLGKSENSNLFLQSFAPNIPWQHSTILMIQLLVDYCRGKGIVWPGTRPTLDYAGEGDSLPLNAQEPKSHWPRKAEVEAWLNKTKQAE